MFHLLRKIEVVLIEAGFSGQIKNSSELKVLNFKGLCMNSCRLADKEGHAKAWCGGMNQRYQEQESAIRQVQCIDSSTMDLTTPRVKSHDYMIDEK